MNVKEYQQYKTSEQYLESLSNLTDVNFFAGTSNPDHHFKRAKHLLKLAGSPDKSLKIIHIAGTSGKGTVVNLIYNILQKTGCKVGAHFSPFVSVATEKIQINNKFISIKEFIELVEGVKPIIKKCYQTYDSPSYFEVFLLMALLYFKKKKCDYVVLETGCGGRFDASNAVVKTACSVITSIGLDHTHILGKTIKKIAYEKAGIIRKAGTVFTAENKLDGLKVIKAVCQEQKACLVALPKNKTPNESLAATVASYLKVSTKAINQGIKSARLPARFEVVQKKPLIILDGAHNQDKIKFLTEKIKKINYNKLHLIAGMTSFKNPAKCFAALLPLVDQLYCTRFLNSFRKITPPIELAWALNKKRKIATEIFLDPQKALALALKKAGPNDLILITGSFFLCSDLRKNWISEEWQLKNRTNFKG